MESTSLCIGLRKVLEEFEKGNEVPISDVVYFIRELDGNDSNDDDEEQTDANDARIEEDIKQTLKLDASSEYLTMNQTMEFLSSELQIDTEEEILKAFRVFDKDGLGVITLAEFNSIMEERGNPLNEEELKMISKCTILFEVPEEEDGKEQEGEEQDGEQTAIIKDRKDENENEKSKANRSRKMRKSKKSKKKSKDSKDSKQASKDDSDKAVRGPQDIKVNYREFVKYLMEKISLQEKNLWGDK